MLGRVCTLGVRNEQADFLIGSSPLGVQLTVVAEWDLQKEDTLSHFWFKHQVLEIKMVNIYEKICLGYISRQNEKKN